MSDPAVPQSDASSERTLRILKAVVIILGVLIVIGLIALVVGIIMKANAPRPGDAGAVTTTSEGTSDGEAAVALNLPAGSIISDMQLDGDRVALRVRTPEGEEIVVIDAKRGRIVGRVKIARAP